MSTGTPDSDHPQTPEDTFGEVNAADIDFGDPALDPDAESSFSSDGFAQQVSATAEDDRITPEHLFANQNPDVPAENTAPVPPVAPVAPVQPGPVFGPTPPPVPHSTANKGGGTKKKALAATAAGLTLLLAGGAFAAYKVGAFGAVGTQPSDVIPATAFAYASIDFNPSAKEKLGAYQLAKQFPSTRVTSTDSFKDDTLAALIDNDASPFTYTRDFKPWIGDRAAVAALPAPGTDDNLTPLLVVEYTDKDAAQKALVKIEKEAESTPSPLTNTDLQLAADTTQGAPDPDQATDFAYAFSGDYVLISDNQHELDAAAATETTLADNETFTHDMDTLGADQFARAWVNTKALYDVIPEAARADVPPEFKDTFNGSFALGAHADAHYLEITGHTFGYPAPQDVSTVRLADALPADTDVALEITGLGASLTRAWNTYQTNDFLDIENQARQAGINLPDDIMTVFGTDFALAANLNPETPAGLIAATTPDTTTSKTMLDRFADLDPEFPVTVTPTDTGYTATNNPTWATRGGLTDDPTFTRAVPHAEDASAFGYLNLAHILDALPATATTNDEHAADLEPLQAVGFSATVDGGHGQFTLRLTTN